VKSSRSEVSSAFRTLILEDEALYARAIAREAARVGIQCDIAGTAAEALERAATDSYQAILVDHRLPDGDGIDQIAALLAHQTWASLVVMTAYDSIPDAVRAIRLGADDYLVKTPDVTPIVQALVETRRRYEVHLRGAPWDAHRREGLLGTSPAIARVREQLAMVAKQPDTTVLLLGETGAGKEVAARWLHALSGPSERPFVVVDCVAIPPTLVEALLFGHEKGVFTGADRARAGAFEEAKTGTLFFDEIGDMDLALQGKLLRVLETRSFHRIGNVREQPVRARIVAATNRDLSSEVRKGTFRHDLYQRLSVYPVTLPPLRERGEDVLILARHFARFYQTKMGRPARPLSREVESCLMGYGFPGNVRELKNVIERAVIIAGGERITLRHLPDRIALATPAPEGRAMAAPERAGPIEPLGDLERRMLQQALEQARGVKSEAARRLGISRFQLLRRLKKYGLSTEPGPESGR